METTSFNSIVLVSFAALNGFEGDYTALELCSKGRSKEVAPGKWQLTEIFQWWIDHLNQNAQDLED